MSRDKERSQDDWEETAEDSYSRQQRLQSQQGKQSQQSPQRWQRSQRPQQSSQQPPRQSQYFREEYDTETPARRRGPRRSERLPAEYYENDYPSRRSRSRLRQDYQDAYETEAPVRRIPPRRREELETDPLRRRRVRPAARPARRRETRPLPKQRRVWPWLLLGCAGGILLVAVAAAIVIATVFHIGPGGNIGGILSQNTYTKSSTQTLPPITHLSQMQVHNQIGNVSILLDQSAAAPTLTMVKKVKATSTSDANKEFDRISVQVQQPADTSLTVTATLPNQSGGVLASNNDSVDMTITLPFSIVSSPNTSGTTSSAAPATFDIATSVGNITLDGLSGVLSIKDGTGSVTVSHAALANGSHLQTSRGNMTFDGSLDTSTSSSTSPATFKISSEVGKLDVTLPASTNVTLDANTNVGKITSDFAISPQSNNGAVSYYGPLISSAATPPTAVFTLDVSTGDISLHKVATG